MLRTERRSKVVFSTLTSTDRRVLFAIGAVSGSVLSFEMGLLWPSLMGRFGDVLGLTFAFEGWRSSIRRSLFPAGVGFPRSVTS